MRLIVFASGKLGCSTLRCIEQPIDYVLTDNGSSEIIKFSKEKGIPCFIGNPRKIADISFLNDFANNWIFSINYLYIIPESIIKIVKDKALNIHGSLLPRYRGRTPHVWAIINGESETGITVHRLVRDVDSGDILVQIRIPIENKDTGGTILNKFEENYPNIVKKSLEMIDTGKSVFVPQNHFNATCFPKRTALDGKIIWDWHDQRIINWVRAQTLPYPGAFTVSEKTGEKIIIWKCEKSDLGYNYEVKNGTVLDKSNGLLFIKCPNHVIKVIEYSGCTFVNDVFA